MSTETNDLAAVVVAAENPLKQMLLEYVGNKFATEEDEGGQVKRIKQERTQRRKQRNKNKEKQKVRKTE